MSEMQVPMAAAVTQGPGLTQMQRVIYTFTAPSKTFNDIRERGGTWLLPFLIITLIGGFLFFAITKEVTWRQVYENNQQNAPEWAKRMVDQMPPDQKAKQDQAGPIGQEISWALSPLGLLIMNLIASGVLLATINFGFGGAATFGKILSVTMYAGLVSWGIRLLLGAIAIFAGLSPESFSIQNVAGTNVAYYLNATETPKALYLLLTYLDPFVIWNLVLTSIGVAIVAGTKRSSGYIAVFGWWTLLVITGLAIASF
jgi:hypothetical protein